MNQSSDVDTVRKAIDRQLTPDPVLRANLCDDALAALDRMVGRLADAEPKARAWDAAMNSDLESSPDVKGWMADMLAAEREKVKGGESFDG